MQFAEKATVLVGSGLFTCALALLCEPLPVNAAQWDTPPVPFARPYGPAGPDGIFGTADDPPPLFFAGLQSGFTGGRFKRNRVLPGEIPGALVTAEVTLDSQVLQLAPGKFFYQWTLTNNGSADLISYFDTNGGQLPNFITVLNNLNFPELDGSAIAPFDQTAAPSSEVQFAFGGPPILFQWGGAWNPGVGAQAKYLAPSVPGPLPIFGLSSAFVVSRQIKRRRRSSSDEIPRNPVDPCANASANSGQGSTYGRNESWHV
jgi:hypothetical protein